MAEIYKDNEREGGRRESEKEVGRCQGRGKGGREEIKQERRAAREGGREDIINYR